MLDENARKNGTAQMARDYLANLYSPEAQEIAAKHYYRPTDKEVSARHAALFPALTLMTIADFGGWAAAQKKHFAEGGTFDQIYASK